METPLFSRYSLFFFSWCLLFFYIPFVSSVGDAEALLALKSSIDQFNSLQWRGSDVCKWPGIKECINGRVTKLVLEYLNLTGELDERTLNQLDELRVLSFKDNSLSGQIPNLSGLINLKSLYLNNNNFSGEFPSSISLLHRLKVVVLSNNQISGPIPDSLLNLRRLYILQLQENRLTGEIPALNQTTLRFLNVSNNQLSGQIPVTPALVRFNASSFSGNINLCGEQIQSPCIGFAPSNSPSYPQVPKSKQNHHRWRIIAIIAGSVGGFLLLCILVTLLAICGSKRRRRTSREVKGKGIVGGEEGEEGGNNGGGSGGSSMQ